MVQRKRAGGWVQVQGQAGLYVKAVNTSGGTADEVGGTGTAPLNPNMRAALDQFGAQLDALERESKQSHLLTFTSQR